MLKRNKVKRSHEWRGRERKQMRELEKTDLNRKRNV